MWRLSWSAWLLSLEFGFMWPNTGASQYVSFMTNMDALMIGCMTALAVRRLPEAARAFFSRTPWAGRLAAGGAIYSVWVLQMNSLLGRPLVPFGTTVQSIAAAYLITSYAIHRHGVVYHVLNLSPIRHLGVLSYSIYIWHQPFFSDPALFGAQNVLVLTFPFNVAAAVALGALSYHALEKPFLSLRQRFRRIDQANTAATEPRILAPATDQKLMEASGRHE